LGLPPVPIERRVSHRLGGGGPGIHNLPVRLVTTGIYRFTRNPMYSGQLIFMLGLTIIFASLAVGQPDDLLLEKKANAAI
jgi:hypothetical protein